MQRKQPIKGIDGTTVAAVHGQSSMKMQKERWLDKVKLAEDVAASRHARPMRMISMMWRVALWPERLKMDE